MFTVRIGHRIHDFDAWKAAFDSDPARREESGVRRYRITCGVGDPNVVAIDLDCDTADEAEAFLVAMRRVWQWPQATAAIDGSPQAEIVEMVLQKEYESGHTSHSPGSGNRP